MGGGGSKLSVKLLVCCLSLATSLAIAEAGASALHHRAYPYLNLFIADARYGVRLQADATTRVRSRDGRITEISTNRLGFRGPQWPTAEPTGTRVLLLGDSQVLGYGVPFEATMGSELGKRLSAEVLAAAVPSWGPHESLLALEELGPALHPTHVVFFANAANDWFETVPNVERTTAKDGWAAAASSEHVVSFPFRDFLLGRSHLVLAARQLAHVMGTAERPVAEPALHLARETPRLREGHEGFHSSLGATLMRAHAACRQLRCELVAAALPLDVQVDAREWRKYRALGVDMSASEALLEDFVTDARDLGVPCVNLLSSLRAAEPDAFLGDDYHLSPAGHRVVADALASLIAAPTAQVTP